MLKPLTVWITINWKILQEMGIPDHLTCLLRKLYASQEEIEPDMDQQTGSKLGKESPCLFNLHAKYIMQNAGLDEAQARIKIARRNINNLRYAAGTTFTAENEEKLKSLLWMQKRRVKKLA